MVTHKLIELDWDTRFFGQKMGKIILDPAMNEDCFSELVWHRTIEAARREKYQFLFCEFDSKYKGIAHLASAFGGSLGDVLVTLHRNLQEPKSPGQGQRVVPAVEEDIPQIIEIARDSFEQSRFFHDPKFDRTKVKQLYPKWIVDSFGRSEQYYVIKDYLKVKAFVSVQSDPGRSALDIRLLAVDPEQRGQGLGRSLLDWVAAYAWKNHLASTSVGTQIGNYPAIRLYEKNGFRIHQARLRFHFWLNSGQAATASDRRP